MTILDAGDITPKQASALFDVALGEFPFFAECAQTVAYNHSGIISPVRLEGKQRTCTNLRLRSPTRSWTSMQSVVDGAQRACTREIQSFHTPLHRRAQQVLWAALSGRSQVS